MLYGFNTEAVASPWPRRRLLANGHTVLLLVVVVHKAEAVSAEHFHHAAFDFDEQTGYDALTH